MEGDELWHHSVVKCQTVAWLLFIFLCVGELMVVGGAFVWMFKLESEVDESESQQL